MSELGPDARSILDAARSRERPTEADRARARRSLMRALAAGGAAAAAATAAGTGAAAVTGTAAGTGAVKGAGAGAATVAALGASGTVSVAGKVIAILVLAGSVSAGVLAITPRQEPPADTRLSATSAPLIATAPLTITPPPTEPPATNADLSLAPESSPLPDTEPPAPTKAAAPAAPRSNPRAASAAAAPPPAEDPLDIETRSLGEAHSALQSGDAARALSLLEKQSSAYAEGELRQERAAARVVALCKLGRKAEARAAAEAFLRENPRSPLSDRVRAACPSSPAQ